MKDLAGGGDTLAMTPNGVADEVQLMKAKITTTNGGSLSRSSSNSSVDFQLCPDSDDDNAPGDLSLIGQKRTSPVDDLIESKRAKLVNGHDTIADSKKPEDNIDLTIETPCAKRSLELPDMSESKKARVMSVDESSTNSCASSISSKSTSKKSEEDMSESKKVHVVSVDESSSNSCASTTSSEHTSKKSEEDITSDEVTITVPPSPQKSQSNLDKAIERVAFGGLDRKERVMMPFIKDLKKKRLRGITMDDLEELITQRVSEVLTDSGDNGVLREKVQKLERSTEFWKQKATSLQKQLSDMTMVFKKLATETKQNPNQMQIPIKITRSVGLQVIMPSVQSLSKNNPPHVRNGVPPGTKRKSGGIMTNRNTPPTIHYPTPSAMSPVRPPTVQKVVTPPVTPVKPPQVVAAPKTPPVCPPIPPAIRFRPPQTMTTTGTVVTVAGNLRTAATSVPNRPVVRTVTPRSSSDMLIDLTDEDDKTKRVSTTISPPQPPRVAQLNGSPPALGSTIRFAHTPTSAQQLTGIATGVNGQRVAYMLPTSASNAVPGRLQLFTQPTGGTLRPSAVITTVRPSTQTLMLKNGTVVSSTMAPRNMLRAAAPGTFQQVVAQPVQMRTIQPAGRLTNGTVTRTTPEPTPNRPIAAILQHPAPLPPQPPEFPSNPSWKRPPPRPDLKISKVDNRDQHGIILSWNMDHSTEHEEIASYQLYAYQENNAPPSTSHWKKVGDVKAMPLPMACTLTQFLEGNKYHFAVRAIDVHSRSGLFSIPGHIILPRRGS